MGTVAGIDFTQSGPKFIVQGLVLLLAASVDAISRQRGRADGDPVRWGVFGQPSRQPKSSSRRADRRDAELVAVAAATARRPGSTPEHGSPRATSSYEA